MYHMLYVWESIWHRGKSFVHIYCIYIFSLYTMPRQLSMSVVRIRLCSLLNIRCLFVIVSSYPRKVKTLLILHAQSLQSATPAQTTINQGSNTVFSPSS